MLKKVKHRHFSILVPNNSFIQLGLYSLSPTKGSLCKWLANCETPVVSSSRSFHDSSRDSWKFSLLTSQNAQKQLFKEFFRGNLVLNLSYPLLNPSFNIFTLKPNQFMVFHSINIFKVILNSFHFFGSLDYVLESFVLLVGIFIIGVGET